MLGSKRFIRIWLIGLIAVIQTTSAIKTIVLKNRVSFRGFDGKKLLNFVATANNWPKFVLSSTSVEGIFLEKPLKRGSKVIELFGLPPLLSLQVEWLCDKNTYPNLVISSDEGLKGIAKDCKMKFDVTENSNECVSLDFMMSYTPLSPLAVLAVPILALDNFIAVNIMLPSLVEGALYNRLDKKRPIDEFRLLMGSAYGIAGLAHAADLVGPNILLGEAGYPSFFEMPFLGQLLAVAWCTSGPLSFFLSRIGYKAADIGLFLYGVIEIVGASLSPSALSKAISVQIIVLVSWLYSRSRSSQQVY